MWELSLPAHGRSTAFTLPGLLLFLLFEKREKRRWLSSDRSTVPPCGRNVLEETRQRISLSITEQIRGVGPILEVWKLPTFLCYYIPMLLNKDHARICLIEAHWVPSLYNCLRAMFNNLLKSKGFLKRSDWALPCCTAIRSIDAIHDFIRRLKKLSVVGTSRGTTPGLRNERK